MAKLDAIQLLRLGHKYDDFQGVPFPDSLLGKGSHYVLLSGRTLRHPWQKPSEKDLQDFSLTARTNLPGM
jgi:hypothetical protein